MTEQPAIKTFAHYCSDCIHRHVCAYADDVLRYERQFYKHGTGTGCPPTVTINCTERWAINSFAGKAQSSV